MKRKSAVKHVKIHSLSDHLIETSYFCSVLNFTTRKPTTTKKLILGFYTNLVTIDNELTNSFRREKEFSQKNNRRKDSQTCQKNVELRKPIALFKTKSLKRYFVSCFLSSVCSLIAPLTQRAVCNIRPLWFIKVIKKQ